MKSEFWQWRAWALTRGISISGDTMLKMFSSEGSKLWSLRELERKPNNLGVKKGRREVEGGRRELRESLKRV